MSLKKELKNLSKLSTAKWRLWISLKFICLSKKQNASALKTFFSFRSLKVTQECLESLTCPENNQLKKLVLRFNSAPHENNHLEALELSDNSDPEENNQLEKLESAITTPHVELFPTFTSNFLQNLKNLSYLDLQLQTYISLWYYH